MEDLRVLEEIEKFSLTDEERVTIEAMIERYYESFNELDGIDTSGIEPLVSVISQSNIMREDIAKHTVTRDDILSGSHSESVEYFEIPGILR
ncbi:MAG: Asp-tRNA(Asn)/Glu-tRNA(Gln) amidotransferase subunit GatC [Oscillospiraceae bacterium]|jgi:aspartyl-tRNA(Asn)/glutamyl-tRNA(Gln) amidotransferase subunit C|nr:Asp-tRNA(Asn)/Glu-tRNA(Gln) amidotransferase subunit GatC [Oscillospiraceae bacterium]